MRTLGGERRVVSVLFADLVGFTTLSERLDPEEVTRLVDGTFERLVRDIAAFGGRVDKIVGDAIVALFGAPVAHEDDAERAVRAALRMQETLGSHAAEVGVPLQLRIGVNTGEVLVGALRAGGDYTAMGDVVNTAARLQTACAPGEVLVGPATYAITHDVVRYDSAGRLQPRGREQAIDVWVARAADRPPGERSRRIRTPLVGRDREMALLSSSIDLSVRHRRGQFVMLLGDAGVGKTRLANEIPPMLLAEEPDALVLSGRCVPYGEANPWWPIADALRAGCGIELDQPLPSARDLTALAVRNVGVDVDVEGEMVNGLLHMMGYDGPLRGLEPARARVESTQSLLAFMEAAVRRRPIVVRLADLHWADDVVLDLIDNMTDQLAREPFVLVGTARPTLLERWSPRAGRHNVMVLTIDPLDRSASSALLDALVDEVPAELRETLLDRAGGNPFFLEELVTLIGVEDPSADAHELPDTLRGLIAARIDALSSDEQLTLEDAAVWGSEGPLEALNRLAEATRNVDDVSEVAASLHDKEVFSYDGDWWSFRSDLVREVAYSRLTKLDRLGRHFGIASYLDRRVGTRFVDDSFVDMVARHYVEAARLVREVAAPGMPDDLDDRALRWLGEAARRAAEAASWPLVDRLYTTGLEFITDDSHTDLPVRFLLGRAEARVQMWRFDEATVDAEIARERAEATGDRQLLLLALTRLGEIASRRADPAAAEVVLSRAAAVADELGDVHGRAEAWRLMGMARLFGGDEAGAWEPIVAALADFRVAGDRRGEAWALQNLAWIAFSRGDIEVAEAQLTDASAAFDQLGDRGGSAWADGLLAFVRFHQGRFDEARELAERVLKESVRRGDNWGQGMMLVVSGAVDLWKGRTAEAAERMRQAVGLFGALGDVVGLEQALVAEARARAMLGDIEEGRALMAEAMAVQRVGPAPPALGGPGMLADLTLAVMTGDLPRLDVSGVLTDPHELGEHLLGLAELDVVAAVALAQLNRLDDARRRVGCAVERDAGNGFAQAGMAMVAAASGDRAQVAATVHELIANPRATYLDRIYGWLSVGLSTADDADVAFESARREIGGTGDVLGAAIVALAESTAARSRHLPDAETLEVEASRRWNSIGVEPAGWLALFERALAAAD